MSRELPILMSGPMVRAILDKRKTQTRRVVRPQFQEEHTDWPTDPWEYHDPGLRGTWTTEPRYTTAHDFWVEGDEDDRWRRCPYGQPGDLLYVRETWRSARTYDCLPPRDVVPCVGYEVEGFVQYEADAPDDHFDSGGRWRRSFHMPNPFARLWLRVTDVRVERVQRITSGDAIREGISPDDPILSKPKSLANTIGDFRDLWDSLNAKRGYDWATNPWVWVVEFEPVPIGGAAATEGVTP